MRGPLEPRGAGLTIPLMEAVSHRAVRSTAVVQMGWFWPLLVVAVLAAWIGIHRAHHDRARWEPDSLFYLSMTLQDRGFSSRGAAARAHALIHATTDPGTSGTLLFNARPPQFFRRLGPLFRNRPLYPALGSVLYPRFGAEALKVVSVLAYFAGTLLIFVLLLQFAPPWIAALGALGFATAPPVLALVGLALTDELALAFWIAALGALWMQVRRPGWPALTLFAAAVLALTFTRPAAYLPFGAALAVCIGAPRLTWRKAAVPAVLIAFAASIAFLVYSHAVHGPGLMQQLRWQYLWQQQTHGVAAGHGFIVWWISAVARAIATELVSDVYLNGALFTIVLAAFGIALARGSLVLPIVIGSAVSTLVAILVNPTEIERTVTLPLVPLAVILATIALQRLTQNLRLRTDGDIAASRLP